MYIVEKIYTPVTEEYECIVLGGGVAGCSAAIAAARGGKKVLLCEKGFELGGLATSGIITIYLPICDGMGRQVSYGLAEELLRLSINISNNGKRGYSNWILGEGAKTSNDPRFEVDFNPHLFAIELERLLLSEGVTILYGTYAVACRKNDDRIEYVMIENKGGRKAVAAETFIDATGDCDIVHFAGVPECINDKGNDLAAWYYSGYGINKLGAVDITDSDRDKKDTTPLVERTFTGLSGRDLSDMMIEAHKVIYGDVLKKRKDDETYEPVNMPSIPQIRMTRRIDGEYTLSEEDRHRHSERSIGMVSDWRKRGPVYEIPFDILYNRKVKNLICAGRCVSAGDDTWDVLRVIPCCAVTGQAAGTAASITDDFTAIDMDELQRRLREADVRLHIDEL